MSLVVQEKQKIKNIARKLHFPFSFAMYLLASQVERPFHNTAKDKDECFFTVCRIRQFNTCSSFKSRFHSVSRILSIRFIIS
jgi:hypothetical protein